MATKKVVKSKKKDTKYSSLQGLSFSDLYALYLFVSNDGNNRGFGATSPDARVVVRDKQREIEEELYLRAYGYNPFKKHKVVFDGVKPEDIDLDRVAVITPGDNKEPEDAEPETFVVHKNKKED
jgi:hypothetical protein